MLYLTAALHKPLSLWHKLPASTKAYLVLFAVLVVFAAPFFLQGKQFSPMDLLYEYFPWRAVKPEWYDQASNALRWDDATKFYPERINLIRNFQQDGMSFWQNDHLLGSPNRPTLHRYGLLFYPPIWLFFVLPFNTANSLIHILSLYIAGLSMWLLLREHGLKAGSALLGSIVFMLNGFLVVWMSAFFLVAMMSLVPLVLLLIERVLRRQSMLYGLGAGLVMALQFCLGYPPGFIVSSFFVILYGIVALIRVAYQGERALLVRSAGLLCFAAVMAACLSAVCLLPTLEQLMGSGYMVDRAGGEGESAPWELLLGFLLPNYWGNPTGRMGAVWTMSGGNYCAMIAYWGITAVAISVFGWLARKHSPQLWTFSILAVMLAVALTYGVKPVSLLTKLPGIAGIQVQRWHFGIVLGGSSLSALGLQYLDDVKRRSRILPIAVLCAITLASVFLFVTVASPETIQARFQDFPRLVSSHYWQISLLMVSILLVGVPLLARGESRPSFTLLALLLVLVDLLAFGRSFNPYIADGDFYPVTPGVRFLQSKSGLNRVAPWGKWTGILPAYTSNVYGIFIVTGMDHYRDEDYRAFLQPLMSESVIYDSLRYGYVRLDQGLAADRLILDLLNVQYIVTRPIPDAEVQLDLVYQGPDMWVYENPYRLPRAWGVPNYELASLEQALLQIHDADFDARTEVLLLENPSLYAGSSPCSQEELKAEVVAYSSDDIWLHTEFLCDGMLVLSERFAAGWDATVDGKPTDVLQANYLLRAVAVPAGEHTVRVRYRPASNRWGAGISLAALAICCGVSGYRWKRWPTAIALAFMIPVVVWVVFAKPFTDPPEPSDRWVDIGMSPPASVAPRSQEARIRDECGEIVLLGYELDKTVATPGDSLLLTLYWQSEKPVCRDYTVFTHLLDSEGDMMAQQDQPPLHGGAPTGEWEEGQIVADMYRLEVNPEASTTTARLAVGMYDWQTTVRVPMYSADGNRLDLDWLMLDTPIEVRR